jgi:hypothetical protein
MGSLDEECGRRFRRRSEPRWIPGLAEKNGIDSAIHQIAGLILDALTLFDRKRVDNSF